MMKGLKGIWYWIIAVVLAVVLYAVGKRQGWFGGGFEVLIDEDEEETPPPYETPTGTWIDPEIETGTSTNSSSNTPRAPQKPRPNVSATEAEKTAEKVARLLSNWQDANDEDEQAFDILLGLNDRTITAVSQAWPKIWAKQNRGFAMANTLRAQVQNEVVWGSNRAHVLAKKYKVLDRLNTLKIN
jgi:hypothetical protein